jgi:Contractile injection system tube protein
VTPPLTKAVLYKLKDSQPAGKGKPPNVKIDGDPITVQFNPTSLRIQRQNNVDAGGSTTRTQHRQNPSQRPATLTLDLEFDTAEGDENGEPQDVRVLTAQIRQFVEPDPSKPADPPPRVLFLWGTLNFPGIVTQLTEDLDYFNYDGMALRAKVSVTITEQNLAFEAMKQGAGARDDTDATAPGGGQTGSGPGSNGTSNPVQAALAQAGESIQQLLTRLDQDPSAWRSAMNGLTSPLSLAAGTQVQLAASASVSAGIGVSAGFAAGASAGLGVSAGAGASVSAGASASVSADAVAAFSAGADVDVVASASASASGGAFAGVSATMAAGFALAAGGGVQAIYNQALNGQVNAAAGAARASFQVPQSAAAVAAQAGAPPSAVTQVDTRAVSYGRGIPLSRRADLSSITDNGAGGQPVIGARASATPG